MSFFNVTQLGVQDHIKTCVKNPGTYPRSISSSGEAAAQIPLRTTLSEPVYPNSEANGSHVKYTERLHKHIRPKLGEFHNLCTVTGRFANVNDVQFKRLWSFRPRSRDFRSN